LFAELPKVTFIPPCDFDRFCQDQGLITDFKLIKDKPVIRCVADYCIDPKSVLQTRVLDYFPKEGTASGGTEVLVRLQNLPAFDEGDVNVQVSASNFVQSARVSSLTQSPASTITKGQAALTFVTPTFTSKDAFATVEIGVLLGNSIRKISKVHSYLLNMT
jgi:hypothetical protein